MKRGFEYLEATRHSHEVGQRIRQHFPHHVRTMDLIRDLADAKMCGGLLVEKSADHQWQYFALTRCQQPLAFPQPVQASLIGAPLTILSERRVYALQQLLLNERFCQKI